MESTGFFFAAFHTGRNVATTVVTSAIAINTTSDGIPNTKSEAPNSTASSAFKIPHTTMLTVDANITHKAEIKNDSEKKILNTSKLLAPTARKIPISFFFCEMDTEIKFDNNSAAKTASTNPTYKNTFDNSLTRESTISNLSIKPPDGLTLLPSSPKVSVLYISQNSLVCSTE